MRRKMPLRPITDRESRAIERDAPGGEAIPSRGFCHECEAFVDEAAGRLHRPACRGVTAERRRTA